MSAMKNYLMTIEATADSMIRKHSGDSRFIGDYEWRKGIDESYITAIVETVSGYFCVQFLERRKVVKVHKESQPGVFVPVASLAIIVGE